MAFWVLAQRLLSSGVDVALQDGSLNGAHETDLAVVIVPSFTQKIWGPLVTDFDFFNNYPEPFDFGDGSLAGSINTELFFEGVYQIGADGY